MDRSPTPLIAEGASSPLDRLAPAMRRMLFDAVESGDRDLARDLARAASIEEEKAGRAVEAAALLAEAEREATERADAERRASLPALLDLARLAETDPTPPRFIIDRWMPEGEATLFAGHGGTGKSQIALVAAVCIAAGQPFYGLRCERRRVLLWSAEDGERVMHWRLRRVCAFLGVDLASLAGRLFLFDATRTAEPFYSEDGRTLRQTAAMEWLREQVAITDAQVAVIDGTSDAFAGNEVGRAQVRAFVQSMRRTMPRDGAVLLLHHVDAGTAHGGSPKGYSGSTAWHNSCRARWYLRPTEEGTEGDRDRVTIELSKSNYGRAGARIELRYSDDAECFVPEIDPAELASPMQRGLRDTDEREAVLRIIREADAVGDPIPASISGPRTCWHAIRARSDCPDRLKRPGNGRKCTLEIIELLRAAGAVRADTVKSGNRNTKEILRAA
ncbi:MAG: AAA family ATPase [Pseudomonadota bacterium]